MRSIESLRKCKKLTNEHGYVDVDKETLQNKKYKNVFALGDCTNLPTSKTASAIAYQAIVLHKNLKSVMAAKEQKAHCDGYVAWSIVTDYGTCIMAEYDYELNMRESLFIRQDRESRMIYLLKKDVMPQIYWNLFVTGKYPQVNKIGKLFSWYKTKNWSCTQLKILMTKFKHVLNTS